MSPPKDRSGALGNRRKWREKRDGQSQEGQEPSPGPKGKLQEMAGGWGFVEGRGEGGSQMR